MTQDRPAALNADERGTQRPEPVVWLLGLLRRRWPWIVAAAVLVCAASVTRERLRDPEYKATITVVLSRQDVGSAVAGIATPTPSADTLSRSAKTQATIAASITVAQKMKQQLGLTATAEQIRKSISATPATDSDVLSVSATSSRRQQAITLVQAAASSYVLVRREIDTRAVTETRKQLAQERTTLQQRNDTAARALLRELDTRDQQLAVIETLATGGANLLSDAPAVRRTHPATSRAAVVGLILGFALGFVIAVLRDLTDRRFSRSEDVATALGLPLIGEVSFDPAIPGLDAPTIASGSTGTSEAFRLLRSAVMSEVQTRGIHRLLVTSAVPSEGKTTVTAVLGCAIAAGHQRTRVIDVDFRRPRLSALFDQPSVPGLTDVLHEDTSTDDVVREINVGEGDRTVELVSAGTQPLSPGEFVASERFDQALSAVMPPVGGLVLLDGPPANPFADALATAREVDGLLVVANLGRLTRRDAATLRKRLTQLAAPSLGVIVVTRKQSRVSRYGHEYGYGYGAGTTQEPSERDVVSRA
jgi:capsular exopolysaccharide synthesis family protein